MKNSRGLRVGFISFLQCCSVIEEPVMIIFFIIGFSKIPTT